MSTSQQSSVGDVPTIGVFDSGVGGLTVLKELLRCVPNANYLYFGDTARLPYGSKSAETVAKYAISAARFLQQQGAEFLVIACNTATALALGAIQKSIRVPAIGVIEPGAQRAAAASKSRCVAVIATEATVASHAYQRALSNLGIAAIEKACPLLVPLVEEGWTEHTVTEQVAQIYLSELLDGAPKPAPKPDVLLLGCTHYPLLRPVLESLAGKEFTIVDSAESTAQAVAASIPTRHATRGTDSSSLRFFATDSAEKFRGLGERFLGRKIMNVEHVNLEV
jgi:glutamate racemase